MVLACMVGKVKHGLQELVKLWLGKLWCLFPHWVLGAESL